MYLIDSDILIDYLRLHTPAVSFLDALKKGQRSISLLSQFELLKGCSSKIQEVRINRFLKNFIILPVNEKISRLALEIFRTKRWAFGIGIVDSFIAGTAAHHKINLASRNKKHYSHIASLKVEVPY